MLCSSPFDFALPHLMVVLEKITNIKMFLDLKTFYVGVIFIQKLIFI